MNIKRLVSFFADAKTEAKKVSWLSRKEVITTTISVFIIVSVFAVFFLFTDLVITKVISFALGIGR